MSAGTLRFWLALVVAVLICSVSTAWGKYPGGYINDLTTTVVTPHIPWAKPYHGGTVRGLFVIPSCYAAREVIELWQRLSLDYDVVTTHTDSLLGWDYPGRPDSYTRQVEGTSPAEKEAQLRRLLQRPHDVIVLGHFNLEALPDELQYELLSQVKAGTGLVMTYYKPSKLPLLDNPIPEGARHILSGVPFGGLPYFAEKVNPEQSLQTARIGQGRVVALTYPDTWPRVRYGGHGLTPLEVVFEHQGASHPEGRTIGEEPLQIYYDYYQSLIAKAVLWAAKKEPALQIALPIEDGAALNWEQARGEFMVELTGAELAGTRIRLIVRDELGKEEISIEQSADLATESTEVTFSLPQISGGPHYLDVLVADEQGTVNWASAYFTVSPPSAITRLEIPYWSCERGTEVWGQVTLPGETEGLRLEVYVEDVYGRLCVRESRVLSAEVDAVNFNLPLDLAVARRAEVFARLYDGEQLLSMKRTPIQITGVRQDEYPMVIWASDDVGWLGLLWLRKLRQEGFTGVFQYYYPEQRSLADMTLSPFMTSVRYEPKDMEVSPWTNEEWRENKVGEIKEHTRRVSPYGVFLYDLGDECYYRWKQMNKPSDFASFRGFLERKYGSLEAADQAWSGVIEDWEQLALITDREEVIATKQYVRYHDQQAHAEYLYANQFHLFVEAIKAVDPEAQVGAEGSNPGNLEQTIKGLDFWGPYNRPSYNALLRSLAPRSLWRGNWWGGYMWQRRPETLRYQLWHWTLEGNNFVEYYASIGSEGFLSADFRLAYFYQWVRRDLQELKHGLGTLIAKSEFVHDGVALLHSQASVHLADLLNQVNSWQRSQDSLIKLLDVLGIQYRYLTAGQVEQGDLEQEKIRLLLLGDVMVVSNPMGQQIRDFVARGGVVIADTSPGLVGGNCESLPAGQLDDLFGISQPGEPQRSAAASLQFKGTVGRRPVHLEQQNLSADANVSLNGGEALAYVGEVPVLIRNHYGQGQTLLLNFAVPSLSAENRTALANLLRGLLAEANIDHAYELTDPEDGLIAGARVMAMQRHELTVLGLTADPSVIEGAQPTELRLPRETYVYEVRHRRYLGHVDSLSLALNPAEPLLLALLPYRVQRVDLQVPKQARVGEPLPVSLRVLTSAGPQPGHVLCLQVIGPDGEERPYYERLVTMETSEAEVEVPFAYNDPLGEWRLRVRDVASGMGASRTVELQPAA